MRPSLIRANRFHWTGLLEPWSVSSLVAFSLDDEVCFIVTSTVCILGNLLLLDSMESVDGRGIQSYARPRAFPF